MTRLLEGIRVLESAQLFNGDRLGGLLADLGADVVKVESPGRGDYLRDFLGQITPHHSPAHVEVNKNKRSITLDLRTDAGREVFWRLLETADVIVDGNVAGTMDALGVGYEAVRARKPGIVFCHYSGFGAAGPYAVIPDPRADDELPRRRHADGEGRRRLPAPARSRAIGWARRPMAGRARRPARLTRRCTLPRPWCNGTEPARAAIIDAAGSDGVARELLGCLDVRAQRPPHHGPQHHAGTGGGRERRGEIPVLRDPRPQGGPVLLHRAEVLARLLRGDRAAGSRRRRDGAPVEWADDVELRRELQQIFHDRDLTDWVALAAKHDIAMGPAYQEMAELPADEHLRSRESVRRRRRPGRRAVHLHRAAGDRERGPVRGAAPGARPRPAHRRAAGGARLRHRRHRAAARRSGRVRPAARHGARSEVGCSISHTS